MPTYPFMQVDAFTDHPLGGNPCAILFEADSLDDVTMLAIAREMNLSETAFVRRSDVANFGVRYFTPAEEIPLAGHPTIATTFALVDSGRLQLSEAHTTITLELKVGPPPPDLLEDPFTGSATGGMAAYLWHYGLIDEPCFVAEQGHWLNRPGLGTAEVIGPRSDIQTVKVGGGAAAVLRGELTI